MTAPVKPLKRTEPVGYSDRDRQESAYLAGWCACMAWLPREPPSDAAAAWREGYEAALDAPFGSRPDIADLMRVGVKW